MSSTDVLLTFIQSGRSPADILEMARTVQVRYLNEVITHMGEEVYEQSVIRKVLIDEVRRRAEQWEAIIENL